MSDQEHLPYHEHQKRICQAKRPYLTKQSAKKAAKALKRVGKHKKSFPYECGLCGKWHLTKHKKYGYERC